MAMDVKLLAILGMDAPFARQQKLLARANGRESPNSSHFTIGRIETKNRVVISLITVSDATDHPREFCALFLQEPVLRAVALRPQNTAIMVPSTSRVQAPPWLPGPA
jgi:hypothetical protein